MSTPGGPGERGGPDDPGDLDEWQRLDPRTLLTGPLKALRQLGLPIVLGLVGLTSSGGIAHAAWLLPTALVVTFGWGAIPWLTTSYRVTVSHLEIRGGLLDKRTVTARLDRVRSVDLESSVLHQALGIVKVKVGTGVDDGQIALDSLSRAAAGVLRTALLHGTRPAGTAGAARAAGTAEADTTDTPHTAGTSETPSTRLAQIDWSWLRFAPLNLVNLAIVVGALVAIGSQLSDVLTSAVGRSTRDWLLDVGLGLTLIGLLVGALVLWIPASCVGYALRWFNLEVTREQGRDGTTLHQRAGLLTTRSTTVEEAKVRGVRLRQQLLIAAAGGAELSLLTIGREQNTPAILPAAPLETVRRIAAEVLGDEAPVTVPVTPHGRVTLWRYLRRAAFKTVGLIAAGMLVTVLVDLIDVDWPLWASIAIVVAFTAIWFGAAVLRFRNLGHALTAGYLVAQSGALTRDRIALETDGIVGWRIEQGYFDRRLGLAQLSATTAAGDEVVLVRDIPLARAVALARAATPRFVTEFIDPPAPGA